LGQAQAQYLTLTHNILTEFLLLGYVSFCNPNTNISGRPSLPLITAATAACFPTTPTNDLVCLWPKEPHFPHLLNRFYLSVGIKKHQRLFFFPNNRLQKLHLRPHLSYFHEFSTRSERFYCQPLRESSLQQRLLLTTMLSYCVGWKWIAPSVVAKGKCNPYVFFIWFCFILRRISLHIWFYQIFIVKFSNLTNYILMILF
jgi:hypothetical protein